MEYRRRLPHQQPDGQALFLTWHLHGSLPHALYPPPGKRNSGKAFVWMDRFLDTVRTGPHHLRRPEVAQLVVDALRWGERQAGFYRLGAYVVMSNHVHALVDPLAPAPRFLKSITAREANRIIGQSGRPFWQSETYDHRVRNDAERNRIIDYIHNNPVKAGLVKHPQEFRWSSAWSAE